MKCKVFLVFLSVLMVFAVSCSNSESGKPVRNETAVNKIIQQDDGTISLDIRKASCYNNSSDPSSNTAEWSFVVSKAGRYNVWLSSATTDTLNLNYNTSVKITLLDERLEVKPVGDKIVLDTRDVRRPYFRADSYMGTFYIKDPGEYIIQLISEKVIPEAMATEDEKGSSSSTKLMSVFLTPMTR